ncbi:MAG: hypothetical protein WCQ44_05170 [Opitutaceae bacterium]|jgi:hypothetical protein
MASKPIPLRISTSMLKEIKATGERLEMTDQETMRFCMRLGLKIIEMSAYDTITTVAEKALESSKLSVKQLVQDVEKRPRMD